MSNRAIVLLACSFGAGHLASAGTAAILSPAANGEVNTRHSVTVEAVDGSVPVVAIRSAEKNSPWWIQPAAEEQSGRYVVDARFGNHKTPSGTEFQLVVLTPATDAAASSLQPGKSMKALPSDAACSTPVSVVLQRVSRKLQSCGAVIQSPAANANVTRLQKVSVDLKQAEGSVPILLVRSVDERSWWVQDSLSPGEDGLVQGLARFGNDKTPSGSRFLLAVIDGGSEQASADMKPGTLVDDLTQYRLGGTIEVVLGPASDTP